MFLMCSCAASGQEETQALIQQQLDHAAQERRAALEESNRALGVVSDQQHRQLQNVRTDSVKRAPIIIEHAPETVNPLQQWLAESELTCGLEFNYSMCTVPLPAGVTEEQRSTCRDGCKKIIEAAVTKAAEDSMSRCVQAYLSDPSPAPPGPECDFELPARADPNGDGSGVTAEVRLKIRSACTKDCRDEGAAMLARAKQSETAARQGEGLVLSYKRCMLAVDSTIETIRYKLHDHDLYQDRMQKADARCRVANRCDWLEEYSEEFSCSYGN